MRTWSAPLDGPGIWLLAADARVCETHYADDQIWELAVTRLDPVSLAVQTTFGMRARRMQIFPAIKWRGHTITDAGRFHSPPVVRVIYPNYLKIECMPFPDLAMSAEYWACESNLLAGRIRLINLGAEPQDVGLQLNALLQSSISGQGMRAASIEGAWTLAGEAQDLRPVIFMEGGATPQPSPYPAIRIERRLPPNEGQAWRWVHVGLKDHAAGVRAARAFLQTNWDAGVARLEHINASLADVETGDPDWDLAFWLTQVAALRAALSPTRRMPFAGLVHGRDPDHGHLQRPDGSDDDLLWGGVLATDAFTALSQILHAEPELAEQVVEGYLHTQDADGRVDARPGLGGQRAGSLCAPLLATLVWRIYQRTRDTLFLRRVADPLLEFNAAWFDRRQDRDQDGFPEWDHCPQSGFDRWPAFMRTQPWGQGMRIRLAETVDLAVYLMRESASLAAILGAVGREADAAQATQRAQSLRAALKEMWSTRRAIYLHRDRDTHQSPGGGRVLATSQDTDRAVGRSYAPPVRFVVRVLGPLAARKDLQIELTGSGRRGRVRTERFGGRRFQWFRELGTATSEKTYARLDRVKVEGLRRGTRVEIAAADLRRQDASLLLPLWAGVPSPNEAERLIARHVIDEKQFWRPNGVPCVPAGDKAYVADPLQGAGEVWMLWNQMLAEGLLRYGRREVAAELVGRLMRAICRSLEEKRAFCERYDPDNGRGIGSRGHLAGLAPLGLFLNVLGVRLISPHEVHLRPGNPFPWPVRITWRGMRVDCEAGLTRVRFPDGQLAEIEGDEEQIVEQVDGEPPV